MGPNPDYADVEGRRGLWWMRGGRLCVQHPGGARRGMLWWWGAGRYVQGPGMLRWWGVGRCVQGPGGACRGMLGWWGAGRCVQGPEMHLEAVGSRMVCAGTGRCMLGQWSMQE